MGTDIHYEFHKLNEKTGEWEELDVDTNYNGEYYIDRHYKLFAVLADVRNGYGFAGSYTHDIVKPILKERRGLPDDVKCDEFDYRFGDHSCTWLMASEILDWFKNTDQVFHSQGVIGVDQYDEWRDNGQKSPMSYCSYTSSPTYDETNDLPWFMARGFKQYKDITHVRVKWTSTMEDEIGYFREMIQKLYDEYGDFRMVMGFDS